MMLAVDFHLHTTESDGTLSVDKLLDSVAQAGLDYFSITDHDTFGAYSSIPKSAGPLTRRLVRGIEINTNAGAREIHILGYGIPATHSAVDDLIADRATLRKRRAHEIVAKLNGLGISISMADVQRQSMGSMIGRPHISRALVELGYAQNLDDAFARYVGSSGAAYVPLTTITPAQAIGAINQSGGVSVLAHPTRNGAELTIEELARVGLRGIEAFSPSHTLHDVERFRALAKKFKLVMTAGSDFHGPRELRPLPGVEVEDSDLAGFLALLEK